MSWTFIKQVCLGNEDEQVDGCAFLSLGVSRMPRTRSKCREKKKKKDRNALQKPKEKDRTTLRALKGATLSPYL